MPLPKIICNYARYNLWANQTLTGWLKTLGNDLLYRQTPSSFPSVDLTLQHMVRAQNFWLAVLTKANISQLDETIKVNAVNTVVDDLLAGSQKMLDTFSAYSEVQLLEQVKSPDLVKSRYEFILHAINHNSYHRGQIITMTRCLGVEGNIPSTDYDVFLWTEPK
jgi:uncharacterized damage-inducible protein DinB